MTGHGRHDVRMVCESCVTRRIIHNLHIIVHYYTEKVFLLQVSLRMLRFDGTGRRSRDKSIRAKSVNLLQTEKRADVI